jgi:hypothetical protein
LRLRASSNDVASSILLSPFSMTERESSIHEFLFGRPTRDRIMEAFDQFAVRKGEGYDSRSQIMSGIILITVPTIQYGGYFLLTSLMNRGSGYMENPLRQNFFRAGHAHAGVIVILSLVCQMPADAAVLPRPLLWAVGIGVSLSAILISSGFFLSVLPPTRKRSACLFLFTERRLSFEGSAFR